jgi:threonine dehydrogenase-like Zn-dependent dehydrogenase
MTHIYIHNVMKALVYYRSVPLFLTDRLLSRIAPRRFFPVLTPLSLREVPFECPTGWVTLKPRLCGICGSDLNLLRGSESVLLEPYASFPFVIGHEMVAEIAEVPPGITGWSKGDRVVVEPLLPCDIRGVDRCFFCTRGMYSLCENFTAGSLPPGMISGFTKGGGGGAAEQAACHPAQLVRLPEEVADERAVLADSLASALQPVLDNFPDDNDIVVVFGAGIIGQHVIRLLRHLGARCTVVAAARYDFQRDLALAGGADKVLLSPNRRTLGAAVGATFLPTTLGGGNLEGGAHVFYDCIASTRSIQEGLLALRGRGRYVMIGTAARVGSLDISSIWMRELKITGSAAYSNAKLNGRPIHTYSKAVEIIADPAYKTEGLLSHLFGLDRYADAFRAAFDKKRYRSVKTAFDMRSCNSSAR